MKFYPILLSEVLYCSLIRGWTPLLRHFPSILTGFWSRLWNFFFCSLPVSIFIFHSVYRWTHSYAWEWLSCCSGTWASIDILMLSSPDLSVREWDSFNYCLNPGAGKHPHNIVLLLFVEYNRTPMPDIYDLDFFFTFNRFFFFFFTLHVCSVPLRGHKNSKTVTFALNGLLASSVFHTVELWLQIFEKRLDFCDFLHSFLNPVILYES